MAAAALTFAGTAVQMFGQHQAAQAEKRAAQMQAAFREAQAQEILRRSRLDVAAAEREGQQLIGDQMASQVGMGGSLSSGNLVMAQAEATYNNLAEIIRIQDEARYQANTVRAQGAVDSALASGRARAARTQMVGTLLTGSYKYLDASGRAR